MHNSNLVVFSFQNVAIRPIRSLQNTINHENLGLWMHEVNITMIPSSLKKISLVRDLVGIYFVHALVWLQVCPIGSYYMAEIYVSGLCLYLTVAEMNTTVNHCGSVTENREMLTLSSLMAPEVVVMTTSGASSDDKVGINGDSRFSVAFHQMLFAVQRGLRQINNSMIWSAQQTCNFVNFLLFLKPIFSTTVLSHEIFNNRWSVFVSKNRAIRKSTDRVYRKLKYTVSKWI